MRTRREFLRTTVGAGAGLALMPHSSEVARAQSVGVVVDDIHSQLNTTRVANVVAVDSEAALRRTILAARREGKAVSIAGGRHAMGGQQFAEGSVLIDTRPMQRGLRLDARRGVVEVDAGIQWPELVERLIAMQKDKRRQWGIIQKQTGADRLSLGGALGANAHGRGLKLRPIIGDVESFTITGGRRASRLRHATPAWSSSCALSGSMIQARSSRAIGTAITSGCLPIGSECKPPKLTQDWGCAGAL
jgi:hypothetical protein